MTAWTAVYNVLRAYNMTTIFGNPGSTEQPFLKDFPSDFEYVLGLQESSVIGMADGFAQATRNPALAVVHSAGGTGNGMGTIMTAFLNRSPLVIMAGTQERQMLIGDPYLTNRDPTLTPLPWVKWAYQPFSAAEVPAAMVRAIAIASMPPQGPVYLSVPLDDWAAEVKMETAIRTVSTVVAPDPQRLADFAARVAKAKKIALVYGEEVDYSLAWEPAIALAELLKAPVFAAPLASRATFPANNPLYHGSLPLGQGPVGEVLSNFDLVLVVGAEVFRYYPWAPGPVLRNGTHLLQITNSPHDAGAARVGDSLLSDARLALEGLLALLQNTTTSHAKKSTTSSSGTAQSSASKTSSAAARQSTLSSNTSTLMTAAEAFEVVAMLRKSSDLLVQESTSNVMDLLTAWPIVEQATYFFSASGFLGWGLPAAVGIAMAQTNRTTIAVIGDGSTQYSIQALYTAVQHKAKVIVLVPRNEEYAILKEFEVYQKTPNCPGMNIPGISAKTIAEGYGMQAFYARTPEDLYQAFQDARQVDGPALVEVQISPKLETLPV